MNVSIPIFISENKKLTPLSLASASSNETEIDSDEEIDEDVESKPETDTKPTKIKAHRFIIYRKGSIKQTSPTSHKEALNIRNTLLESIADFKF